MKPKVTLQPITKGKVKTLGFSNIQQGLESSSNPISINLNVMQANSEIKQTNKTEKNKEEINFQEMKKTNEKVSRKFISLWGSIKSHLKFCLNIKTMDSKEKVYLKTRQLYSKTLDICDILHKVQEIDKLKAILLSPQQKTLFNLMTKPMMILDQGTATIVEKEESHMLWQTMQYDLEDEKKKATKIINEMNISQNKTDVDQRLLKFIEKSHLNQNPSFKIKNK